MKIGELAEQSGVSRDALRLYADMGLLNPRRLENGYRDFPASSVQMVSYIKLSQHLGFNLREIQETLPALVSTDANSAEVENLLRKKIDDIDNRIDNLRLLRSELATRLESICPIALRNETG